MKAVTVLDKRLKKAGIPIHGVSLSEDGRLRIDIDGELTSEQQAAMRTIYHGWDPAYEEQHIRQLDDIKTRHILERETGVRLSNGWRMRFADDAMTNYERLLSLLNLALNSAIPIEGIPIYNADGQRFIISASGQGQLTPQQAIGVLTEYAMAAAREIARQLAEYPNED